jgi:hypothetical protein
VPSSLAQIAYDTLKDVPHISRNRGAAAGVLASEEISIGSGDRLRIRPFLRNGEVSAASYANPVASGVVGYFDRAGGWYPYCRATSFNLDHHAEFERARPFIRCLNDAFAGTVRDRYIAQADAAANTHPDFVIGGTCFTTLTVNENWRTAVHTDRGDYKAGFGVMCALEAGGGFRGGELVFPKYGVAVDMRTGGVLFADVHELHGNNELEIAPGGTRLSIVAYFRAGMLKCGSRHDELARGQRRSAR